MSHRVMVGVIMVLLVALLLVFAGLLWARAAAPRVAAPKGGDFSRCLSTCNTMVKYYSEKRPTLKAHNGEKQCWQTCSARFGGGKDLRTTQAMKAFWAERRPTNLHANQCAQACWRNFHKGSATVRMASLKSIPRGVICKPGETGRLSARAATSPSV